MTKPLHILYAAAALYTALPFAATAALAEKGDPIAPVAKAQSCQQVLHQGFDQAIVALNVSKDGPLIVALKNMQDALDGKGNVTTATVKVINESINEKGFTTVIGAECRAYAYTQLGRLTEPKSREVMVQRTFQPDQLSR